MPSTARSPSKLRKSLSVDSFVRLTRPDEPSTSTVPATAAARYTSPPNDRPPSSSRVRTYSVSTADTSSRESSLPRTLSDPTVPPRLSKSRERTRRISEEPLPLNLPQTRPRPSPLNDLARTGRLPGTSQYNPVRKSSTSRARSGSLGMNNPTSGVAMVINTQLSSMPNKSLVTVAVVGCYGCGKSSIIKKGCKAYAMSEPTTGIPATDGKHSFRYTSRLGRINQGPNMTGSLRILEVDLSEFNLDDSSSKVWPDFAPRVDGVIVCYDSSSLGSFTHVERLVCGYNELELPTVVMACKSDAVKEVDPHTAATMLRDHKVGLVEVSMYDESGKDKMRRCFDWMVRAIYRDRSSSRADSNSVYRNPASPDVLNTANHPWDLSRPLLNSPPADGTSMTVSSKSRTSYFTNSPPTPRTPPKSPTRARSHNDLLSLAREREEKEVGHQVTINNFNSRSSLPATGTNGVAANQNTDNLDSQPVPKRQDQRLSPWAYLDDLFEKLLFSVVSDDDATFVSNFMLTYRRFATPRSVLLTMQKKMRQLDQETADPMFACLAQMNICRLLADWIKDYPYDFAVRGTAGALSALVKSIIAKTYLIHYGLEFLPFLETLPSLVDKDAGWALKFDSSTEESDDSYSMLDEEEVRSVSPGSENLAGSSASARPASPAQMPGSRERKHSLPLSRSTPKSATSHNGELEHSSRTVLRELQRISADLFILSPVDVAQEITRVQKGLFLNIQPRHWLKHTLSSGPKDPETDTIAKFNRFSNHIGDWVASLILCHDRPKARARQIERFVEIGVSLRNLNNYSGLRALVAGINAATYSGDMPMEIFKQKALEAYKSYQSWDLLFQAIRSHRAYRMALRNTKGACIPALEVHLLDLIRAHEGNPDYSGVYPSKIHWAKFNMIGRFIAGTVQAQEQCRQSPEYTFEENPEINGLVRTEFIMDADMRDALMSTNELDGEYGVNVSISQHGTREQYSKDTAILRKRKIIFWAS